MASLIGGKRAFAYPINKKESGYYLVVDVLHQQALSMNLSVPSVSQTTSSATSSSVFPRLKQSVAVWPEQLPKSSVRRES